jgi:hypothetical protein
VGGANAHKEKQTFPKSFPPKSSAFAFLHLTLSARSARGTAKPHWLSLEGGQGKPMRKSVQKFENSDGGEYL